MRIRLLRRQRNNTRLKLPITLSETIMAESLVALRGNTLISTYTENLRMK